MNVDSIVSVPSVPGLLFAGTDRGVFRTEDIGVFWTQVNTGLTSLNVRTLTVQPGLVTACAPPCLSLVTVYAGTAGGGVFRSTNSGEIWAPANAGLGSRNVVSLAFGPAPNPLLLAGTSDFGVWRSANGGLSWQPSNTGLTDLRVRSVAVDPTNGSVAYAVAITDVFKTTDGGTSWSRTNAACCGWMLTIGRLDPSTLYLASGGIYKSVDAGSTWTYLSNGLNPSLGTNFLSAAVDPSTTSVVWAGKDYGGAFASFDGGAHWVAASEGLPRSNSMGTPAILAFEAVSSGLVYAATTRGVFRRTFDPASGSCGLLGRSLRLTGQRFGVGVSFRSPSMSAADCALSAPLTPSTGAFWFFDPTNLELVVKVLDGRSVNGKFWVFYGSLTNVEFTLTVTDTLTGAGKTYFNPQGQMASVADTSAF